MAVKKGKLMIGLGIGFFAIGIIGLAVICGMFYASTVAKTQYGIVIDAGSSHSSLFTYSWPAEDKIDGTPYIKQHFRCDVKGHSLSSYQDHPSEAGPSLKNCLDEASRNLSWASRPYTPVYLGATAGMRLVALKNETIARRIIESVKETIGSTDLGASYLDQRVKIISGHVEAETLWISVNSMLGLLGDMTKLLRHETNRALDLIPSGDNKTFGILDLGGASTQIAFNLTDSFELPDEYHTDMKLYGAEVELFTDSFLCYGQNEAHARLLSLIARNSNYSSNLKNPCANNNYTSTQPYSEVFESICTKPYHPTQEIHGNVTFTGTGNSTECSSTILEMFNRTNCTYSSCSFDGHPLPTLPEKLVARSAYFYTVSGLGVLNGTRVDKEMFQQAMKRQCSQTLVEARNTNYRYPDSLCYSASYVNVLLTEVYGLQSFDSIMFTNKIDGMDVEWTLGYMIAESTKELKYPSLKLFQISDVWFILVAILTVILIILGLVLIFVSCCVPKYREGYRAVGMRSDI